MRQECNSHHCSLGMRDTVAVSKIDDVVVAHTLEALSGVVLSVKKSLMSNAVSS